MTPLAQRGVATLALGTLFGTVALSNASAEPTQRPEHARTVQAPDGSRIAAVRMFQSGAFTTRGQTPESVGQVLARLRPTFVMAPVRYAAGDRIDAREVAGWNTVREAVRAARPKAQLAVALNALHYERGKPLARMMSRVRRRLAPDAWVFDFYGKAAERRMAVMRKAVAAAHRHGESVGGIIFRVAKPPQIPARTDFVLAQGGDFRLNGRAIRSLAERVEVFVQIGNNPRNRRSDGCRFIRDMSTKERSALIRRRAREQVAHDFRFAYPVFFPTCRAGRVTPTQQGGVAAYDASKDGRMLERIERLMNRHE